jgi:hypothetical protein
MNETPKNVGEWAERYMANLGESLSSAMQGHGLEPSVEALEKALTRLDYLERCSKTVAKAFLGSGMLKG